MLVQAVKLSKDKKMKKNEAILAKKMKKNENLQGKNEKNEINYSIIYTIQLLFFFFSLCTMTQYNKTV